MIRLLTQGDAESFSKIVLSRNKFSSVNDDQKLDALKDITFDMLDFFNLSSVRLYGYFSPNLLGVLVSSPSSYQPSYYITRAHTLKGIENGKQVLSGLIKHTVTDYETAGYKRFSTLYEKESLVSVPRLWDTKNVLPAYSVITELEVLANTKPKQTETWEILFGRTLLSKDSVVRTFFKNEL